jgi:pimeloyl-ACP methyl ester carboxylesterase
VVGGRAAAARRRSLCGDGQCRPSCWHRAAPFRFETSADDVAGLLRHDVPDGAVRSVRAATLIVVGDRDIVRLEHAVELTRLIRDARLLVLPGGHGDYLGEAVGTQEPTECPS